MKDHVSIGVEKRLRFALLDDERNISDVVYLAREFHEESRFGNIPFAPEKVKAISQIILQDPSHQAVTVCRERGEAVGAMHGSAGEYNIAKDAVVIDSPRMSCNYFCNARYDVLKFQKTDHMPTHRRANIIN